MSRTPSANAGVYIEQGAVGWMDNRGYYAVYPSRNLYTEPENGRSVGSADKDKKGMYTSGLRECIDVNITGAGGAIKMHISAYLWEILKPGAKMGKSKAEKQAWNDAQKELDAMKAGFAEIWNKHGESLTEGLTVTVVKGRRTADNHVGTLLRAVTHGATLPDRIEKQCELHPPQGDRRVGTTRLMVGKHVKRLYIEEAQVFDLYHD